jgi:hypothetical protein
MLGLLYANKTSWSQVAFGLVTLTESADGALFSGESRAAVWRRKMAFPTLEEAGESIVFRKQNGRY